MNFVVENLCKLNNGNRSLDDISFNIKNNEIIGIKGPSHAGKSLLLRVLAGITQSDFGNYRINGESVYPRSQKYKKQLGYLPQDAPIYSDLKTSEYVSLIATLREFPLSSNLIDEVKSYSGIEKHWNTPIHALSPSAKKCLSFIQCYLHNPKIVLLDSPFIGLESEHKSRVLAKILKEKHSTATLIVSHDTELLNRHCDKIFFMEDGNLFQNENDVVLPRGDHIDSHLQTPTTTL
ncbi:MAG: ABC transporter ATP-binding protein [Pseudobacteriovorax sp.]|nr:ABC transporter ATP-binding protein [Pseudobacteriovorax sp.]